MPRSPRQLLDSSWIHGVSPDDRRLARVTYFRAGGPSNSTPIIPVGSLYGTTPCGARKPTTKLYLSGQAASAASLPGCLQIDTAASRAPAAAR